MHIDIDLRRVDLQIQGTDGIFLGCHIGGERPLKGGGHGFALDVSAVDENVLHIAIAVGVITPADVTGDEHAISLARDGEELRGKVSAVERPEDVFHVPVPCRREFQDLVGEKTESNLGVRHRHLLHLRGARLRLGPVLFQEFPACRYLTEQVLDEHGRAVRGADLRQVRHRTPVRDEHRTARGIGRLGDDGELRHGGDGGQCLPAEAERHNPVEVIGSMDFTRRVTADSDRQILRRHTAAVIGDADGEDPPAPYLHRHLIGTGVDGVLHQLLEHGGRAIDHLARGDQVGNFKAQYVDFSHFVSL